jgi:uncharacterized membrane protein
MENLLIRLLICIGIIWLTQTLLGAFGIKEPANRIIFVIVIILAVLWLVFGYTVLPIR